MKKTFFLLLFLLPMMVKAQVALTTSTSSYTQNFDGKELGAGIYFIKITKDGAVKQTLKVVKS